MANLNPKTPIQSWEEVYIDFEWISKWTNTQWLSIGYVPTYSLVLNIVQITNFDTMTMVLEI
jgi:hypothetical protein